MEAPVSLQSLLQPEYLQFWPATEGADKPPLQEAHQGNTIRITTTMQIFPSIICFAVLESSSTCHYLLRIYHH